MTRDSQRFADKKKRKIIAGCCFLAVIFFITLFRGDGVFRGESDIIVSEEIGPAGEAGGKTEPGAEGAQEVGAGAEGETARIVVDVAGAVSRPGILLLPEGSRVYEAIEGAGGAAADGDLRDINLAEVLMDGEKLYIPWAREYAQASGAETAVPGFREKGSAAAGSAGGSRQEKKININTADFSELQLVKGVGPSTAQRILDYREENGRFRKVEDIMNVKGIGEKTFEKMKDMISVT